MPKIDMEKIEQTNRTGYPATYRDDVSQRWQKRIGPHAGFKHLGATQVVLKPGAWSSQRHWHEEEDEFLIMLSGEAVLVEDDGETILRAGDYAAWPAGVRNGHHLINRSDSDCSFICLSAGNRSAGGGYSDIDMIFTAAGFLHRDGTPYGTEPQP